MPWPWRSGATASGERLRIGRSSSPVAQADLADHDVADDAAVELGDSAYSGCRFGDARIRSTSVASAGEPNAAVTTSAIAAWSAGVSGRISIAGQRGRSAAADDAASGIPPWVDPHQPKGGRRL